MVNRSGKSFDPRIIGRLLVVAFLCSIPCASAQHGDLTPQEHSLWVEKDIGSGAPHLAVLNVRRAQGEVTELRVLVILVEFPDESADHVAHPPRFYEDLLFSRGTHPTGSVADYLAASSNGRLQFTGAVRGWVTLSQDKNRYVSGLGGLGTYPYNAQRLAEEAIALVDTVFNYADIDNEGPDGISDSGDDDEIVDGIILVHAGPGREGGNPGGLTSVMWATANRLPVDGVFAKYFTLNPEDGDIGIFVHELGHLMGLPDLYDTKAPPSYGLGLWSVMAGGLTLGAGKYPADFDAYSKMVLGFADVIRLKTNSLQVNLIPTQDGGSIYRLWGSGGQGREFFLVEARRNSGLDVRLPGSGLLIYHIDDAMRTNNNPERYLAALEQADALYQLEGFYDDYSIGDDGDPFHEGDIFSRYSTPSSSTNNRTVSSAAVSGIHGPATDGSMTADMFVEPVADVSTAAIEVAEGEGNGDGVLQVGEIAYITPRLRIEELAAHELTLALTPFDATGVVTDGEHQYPLVPIDNEFVTDPFKVRLQGPYNHDPQVISFNLEIGWRGSPGRMLVMKIGVGENQGLNSDFNTRTQSWHFYVATPGYRNAWFYDATGGPDDSGSFRCGLLRGGINNLVDTALESPLILLPPDAELHFDQKMDLPDFEFGASLIGGVVEISVNGSEWDSLVPDGGYSHRFIGPFPGWLSRRVFAGLQENQDNPGFQSVRVDLSKYGKASARVRFRLASSIDTERGTGWFIDNVRVQSSPTPVSMLAYSTEVEGEDLHLFWETDESPVRTIVWRGRSISQADTVGVVDAGRASAHVVDRGGALRENSTYWLEFLNRDGSRETWGPWRVENVPPLRFTVEAQSGGSAEFHWSGPVPETSRLNIYDVQGRLVWSYPVGRQSAHRWGGQTKAGSEAVSGVYFARLTQTHLSALKFVRVIQ